MFPVGEYAMSRMRQEDLLREAENERLVRAAKRQRPDNWNVQRKWANWLGMHMVRWGQKLERFGTLGEAYPSH